MNDPVHRFRMAMAKHLGRMITPEVAAAIEAEAFHVPDRSLDLTQFAPRTVDSITFHAERLADIVDEIDAISVLHWQETEKHRHGIAMAVDYPVLIADERRGTLVQFTARDQAGKLVGNFRAKLRVSLHTQTPYVHEDTWYLLPEARRGWMAKHFLFYARDCLLPLGYREFRASVKKKTRPAAARLLEWCGFEAVATEYVLIVKELTDVC